MEDLPPVSRNGTFPATHRRPRAPSGTSIRRSPPNSPGRPGRGPRVTGCASPATNWTLSGPRPARDRGEGRRFAAERCGASRAVRESRGRAGRTGLKCGVGYSFVEGPSARACRSPSTLPARPFDRRRGRRFGPALRRKTETSSFASDRIFRPCAPPTPDSIPVIPSSRGRPKTRPGVASHGPNTEAGHRPARGADFGTCPPGLTTGIPRGVRAGAVRRGLLREATSGVGGRDAGPVSRAAAPTRSHPNATRPIPVQEVAGHRPSGDAVPLLHPVARVHRRPARVGRDTDGAVS